MEIIEQIRDTGMLDFMRSIPLRPSYIDARLSVALHALRSQGGDSEDLATRIATRFSQEGTPFYMRINQVAAAALRAEICRDNGVEEAYIREAVKLLLHYVKGDADLMAIFEAVAETGETKPQTLH